MTDATTLAQIHESLVLYRRHASQAMQLGGSNAVQRDVQHRMAQRYWAWTHYLRRVS